MTNPVYEPEITALLCIDLYNDFLAEGGKLFPWVKDIAEENNMHENLRKIVAAARKLELPFTMSHTIVGSRVTMKTGNTVILTN